MTSPESVVKLLVSCSCLSGRSSSSERRSMMFSGAIITVHKTNFHCFGTFARPEEDPTARQPYEELRW